MVHDQEDQGVISTDIPYVRDELIRIAFELNQAKNFKHSSEIVSLLPIMIRTLTKKAPPVSHRVTAESRDSVKKMLLEHPDMTNDEIARRHSFIGGRVTEIDRGRYDHK